MKLKVITIIVFMLSCCYAFGQDQEVIAKFVVIDARINNVDYTREYVDSKSYFVFYRQAGDKATSFGGVMDTKDSQSYGFIFEIHNSNVDATVSNYKQDTYSFKWSYQNTYDKKKGTASVKLVKIYKPAGVAFELTIVPENLDLMIYKGYMEGSLKDIE